MDSDQLAQTSPYKEIEDKPQSGLGDDSSDFTGLHSQTFDTTQDSGQELQEGSPVKEDLKENQRNFENLEEQPEPKPLKTVIKAKDVITNISGLCDQLLHNLSDLPSTSHLNTSLSESDHTEMYRNHIKSLTSDVDRVIGENHDLRRQIRGVDEKIRQVLMENRYLRWENEQLEMNNSCLRGNIDEQILKVTELQSEIKLLKQNQEEINRIHKLHDQNLEKAVRKEMDRNFETKTMEMRARLEEEIKIRKGYQQEVKGLRVKLEKEKGIPGTIIRLVEENKNLYLQLMELQMRVDNTEKHSKPIAVKSELRAKLEKLSSDYAAESEHRKNLTKIVLELSEDLKKLIYDKNDLKNN